MTRTKALAKLYESVSGTATKKVTTTAILKELYYAVIGEETTKNNIADILSEMADNYEVLDEGLLDEGGLDIV